MRARAVRTVAVAATAVAAAALLQLRRTWVVITVSGPSMQPTYRDGDRVVVRRRMPVATGDVIVIENRGAGSARAARPHDLKIDRWMIKRVGAVAGEPVPSGIPVDDEVVPPGQLVLLGDNPAASFDSRAAGYFPATAMLGKVTRQMSSADPGS